MLPKKPRELPVLPPQDRKGEPKRTDPEDRDQLVGEGGRSRRLRPRATCHGTTRLETCVGDEIRVWTLS